MVSEGTYQGHPMFDLNLSLYEINCLKKIWKSLDIVHFPKVQLRNKRFSMVSCDERSQLIGSGTWQYNNSRLAEFEHKLCSYVHHLESDSNEKSFFDNESTFDSRVVETVKWSYQVMSLITLVTTLVDHLEFNKGMPVDMIISTSKKNSRIWSLTAEHYSILGESTILAMLDLLGRDAFSIEQELIFIKFYSRLTTLLMLNSRDPEITTAAEADNVSTSSPSSSMRRSSYGESQLSLYDDADDTISLITIDQSQEIDFKRSIDDVPDYVSIFTDVVDEELTESQEDDTSYDLLNSFDATGNKKKLERKKSKTLQRLNRLNPRNIKLSSKRHSFIRFPDFS